MSTKLSKITADLALILALIIFLLLFFLLGGWGGEGREVIYLLSVLLLSYLIYLLCQHGKLSFAEC